ncbi:MAG: bifunctional hydroxymethylpyrimidine kinase/phosphomethylpyrimidine kinase [Terriglobales bacterium]
MPAMPPKPPVVLSIAGFDPSSGAGVTADVQTIRAHGCYPITCITALTVQTTQGVKRVEPVAGALVRDTLRELAKDFEIAAVRIGMLGSGEVAKAVAEFLLPAGIAHVVLDPITKSSSGADLIDKAGLKVIREKLLQLAEVITPNLEEAAALIGSPVRDGKEVHAAPRKLHAMGARAVVITGGHREEPIDLLSIQGRVEEFWAEKIESRSTHGTGCAFATSIACCLAKGKSVPEAVLAAKRFVRQGIEKAEGLGKGTGPLKLI